MEKSSFVCASFGPSSSTQVGRPNSAVRFFVLVPPTEYQLLVVLHFDHKAKRVRSAPDGRSNNYFGSLCPHFPLLAQTSIVFGLCSRKSEVLLSPVLVTS